MAFANGSKKPERMIIKKPFISMVESNGNKIPKIAKEADKYNEDDLNPYLIIEALGGRVIKANDEPVSNDNSEDGEINTDDVDVNKLMDEEETEEEGEDDWLKGL